MATTTTPDEKGASGAPRIHPELRRTEPVYVTLRPWEKRALDRISEITGRSRSDLLRQLTVPWLTQQVDELGIREEVDVPEELEGDS